MNKTLCSIYFNLEDQVIFPQSILSLAFDEQTSNCKTAYLGRGPNSVLLARIVFNSDTILRKLIKINKKYNYTL